MALVLTAHCFKWLVVALTSLAHITLLVVAAGRLLAAQRLLVVLAAVAVKA